MKIRYGIAVILLLLPLSCAPKEEAAPTKNNVATVFSRNGLQQQAKRLAEAGDLDGAIALYKQAMEPQYLNQEIDKGGSVDSLRDIYKWKGDFKSAREMAEWFLKINPDSEESVMELKEIDELENYASTGDPSKVYEQIELIKSLKASGIPPQGFRMGYYGYISDIIRLYDTIGDLDSGIKYIDEVLTYFRSGKAGDPEPGPIDFDLIRIREAFQKDKAEGKKGRATKALIQSDHFPW